MVHNFLGSLDAVQWQAIAAIGTVGSALSAALAAWFSARSAKAARLAASEMREGRLQAHRPLLRIQCKTELKWILSPRSRPAGTFEDADSDQPDGTIRLTNRGAGPALDVALHLQPLEPEILPQFGNLDAITEALAAGGYDLIMSHDVELRGPRGMRSWLPLPAARTTRNVDNVPVGEFADVEIWDHYLYGRLFTALLRWGEPWDQKYFEFEAQLSYRSLAGEQFEDRFHLSIACLPIMSDKGFDPVQSRNGWTHIEGRLLISYRNF